MNYYHVKAYEGRRLVEEADRVPADSAEEAIAYVRCGLVDCPSGIDWDNRYHFEATPVLRGINWVERGASRSS